MPHRPLGHADLVFDEPSKQNGSSLRVSWIVVLSLVFGLIFGLAGAGWTGYMRLDAAKADRETVTAIQQDVRDLRNALIGPPRLPRELR